MKTLTHIVLPIAILMGIVGVVAYITQHTKTDAPKLPSGADQMGEKKGPAIVFDDRITLENLDSRPVEVEYLGHGHKDFWFHTAQEKDVRLGLIRKSCTCSDVDLGRFDVSDAEWDDIIASWKAFDGPSLIRLGLNMIR